MSDVSESSAGSGKKITKIGLRDAIRHITLKCDSQTLNMRELPEKVRKSILREVNDTST